MTGTIEAAPPEPHAGPYCTPSEKLETIASLLADPAKMAPAMLRIKIRAIYEGVEVPDDIRSFVALAERAGVRRNRRYGMWAHVCAELAGEDPDAAAAIVLPREAEKRHRTAVTTALYRWWDEADVLLYIGISDELLERLTSHVKDSAWMDFAVRSTITRYPSRTKAEVAEVEAIKGEQPLFNLKHNNTPEARRRLFEYLVEHGRTDIPLPCISRE